MARTDLALTPEFALLVACVRPPDDADAKRAVREAIDVPIDWPLVLRLADRHRVTSGLADGLARAGVIPPQPVARALHACGLRAAHDELAFAALARRTLAALSEGGIEAAVLKGPPLSMAIHGRLGVRTSRDLDLLIRPGELAGALERLAAIGLAPVDGESVADQQKRARWMRRFKDVELTDNSQRLVELHWRLFDNPHLLPLSDPLGLSRAALDRDADCLVLPERLNLLYLCNHGAQHAWSRLKWLADVAALLFRLGADGREQLYRETLRREGQLAVAQTLLLCGRLFAMPPPSSLERHSARLSALTEIAIGALVDGGEVELEAQRFGSTRKNLSHYLISTKPAYLAAEAWFDMTDQSAFPAGSQWRRFGFIGRITRWVARLFHRM